MREADESLPTDLHHRLDKLDQEVSMLRSGQNSLGHEVGELRVAIASLGRPNWGVVVALAGVFFAIAVQTAYAVYWGGGVNARLESVMLRTESSARQIEEHVRTAGPFRANMDAMTRHMEDCERRVNALEQTATRNQLRIDKIEERNRGADANWDYLKRKGLLMERSR